MCPLTRWKASRPRPDQHLSRRACFNKGTMTSMHMLLRDGRPLRRSTPAARVHVAQVRDAHSTLGSRGAPHFSAALNLVFRFPEDQKEFGVWFIPTQCGFLAPVGFFAIGLSWTDYLYGDDEEGVQAA